MNQMLLLLTECTVISIATTQSLNNTFIGVVFVSDNGYDHDFCGGSATNACGTLYHASILANQNIGGFISWEINIEGQNATDIINYQIANNTDNNDPCLPITFSEDIAITIYFDDTVIQDMSHWFPINVCDNKQNHIYNNEYMFEGGNSITIENLIINNYPHIPYNFIKNNKRTYENGIECVYCVFSNISSQNQDSLFYSRSDIYLDDTQFVNVTAFGNFIFVDHNTDAFDTQTVEIRHTFFKNTMSFLSLLAVEFIANEWEHPIEITMSECEFYDVSNGLSIITQKNHISTVYISQIVIHNLLYGSVYISQHTVESAIYIDNISVTVKQSDSSNENALFSFRSLDSVQIHNMNVVYKYNITDSCTYSEDLYNSVINALCYYMTCSNPPALMQNYGQAHVQDILIKTDIDQQEMASLRNSIDDKYKFIKFNFIQDSTLDELSLIRNHGSMNVNNVNVTQSLSFILLYNTAQLSISYLVVSQSKTTTFDPNALQSWHIVVNDGREAIVSISHCQLRGGFMQIGVNGGKGYVNDCVFQNAMHAFVAYFADEFVVTNSIIQNAGRYYTEFKSDDQVSNTVTSATNIWSTDNILFQNNSFSCYDPYGIIVIRYSSNIVWIDNTFNIDTTGFYYNVTHHDLYFKYAVIYIQSTTNTTIAGNHFEKNQVEPSTEWILYYAIYGTNCLSGNIFTNVAFSAYYTNITSCLRPHLIDCMHNENNICADGMYGSINVSFYDQIGEFFVDASSSSTITSVWTVGSNDVFVALDNIHFNITNANSTNEQTLPLLVDIGNVLIIDSYISMNESNDISYLNSSCDVIYNDRINNHHNHIAKLMIKCTNSDFATSTTQNIVKTLDATNTRMIGYLSATKINLITATPVYYPAKFQKFEYLVMDKFNNVINNTIVDGVDIALISDSFTVQINIDENGDCIQCDAGLVITGISLQETFTEYTISIFVDNDLLIPWPNEEVILNVSACPIGYGADANNYLCQVCSDGTYNLMQNNANHCKSCDSHLNPQITCIEGDVYIDNNYWMGFVGDKMISSICVQSYCCNNHAKCSYIYDKDALCALNRDYESILCSKCTTGYSESINTEKCVKCKQKYYFSYLLLPMAMAFTIFSYLMLTSTNVNKRGKKKGKPRELVGLFKRVIGNGYFMLMLKIMITKNMLYYEQGLSQILSRYSFKYLLYGFTSFWNVSIDTLTKDTQSLCFMDGLNAKQKLLMDFFVPTMVILFIALFFVISKCMNCVLPFEIYSKPNYPKLLIATFLVIVGKLLEILCTLLHCKTVGNMTVHFYFAYEECYGITWFISLLSLIFIVIIFGGVTLKLKSMGPFRRQVNQNNIWNMLTSKYKPRYYYWEFVLFMRRVFIAVFAVSAEDILLQYVFVLIMVVFLFFQYHCDPFVIKSTNTMEFILLLTLICVIMMQFSLSTQHTFIAIFISFAILLPLLLMIYNIYQWIKQYKYSKSDSFRTSFQKRIKFLMFSVLWYYLPHAHKHKQKENGIDIYSDSTDRDAVKRVEIVQYTNSGRALKTLIEKQKEEDYSDSSSD